MPRYLQRLISAGIFAAVLGLAMKISDQPTRTGRDKALFSLIACGFTVVGLLAVAGAVFVSVQIAKFGGASLGVVVAVALLLLAGAALVGIGIALIRAYASKSKAR